MCVMRGLIVALLVVSGFYLFKRYKYRLANYILAFNVVRRLTVALTMNFPYVRNKIIPSIFGRSAV